MPNQTGMFNVPQIQDRLAGMSQQQLFQEGQANQNDALMFSLVNNENMNRQKAKAALMAQQAGQQQPPVKQQDLMAMAPQPNQVPSVPTNTGAGVPLQGPGSPQQMGQNQLPEEQGIGALPANNLQSMAGGGITGYATGGSPDYSPDVYRRYAIQQAQKLGLPPTFVDGIFTNESQYNPNAKSKTGPIGIGQLAADTAKGYGLDPSERTDGFKNIDASLAFMKDLQGKYKNDPQKMALAYNQGETFTDKHLKANNGQVVPDNLNKPEAVNYLKKLTDYLPVSSAHAEVVPGIAPAPAATINPVDQIPGVNPVIAKEQAAKAAATPQYITGNQGVIGAGETALQYGTGLLSIPTAGIAALGNRLFNGVPMEDTFKRLSNEVTYSPRTEGGKAVSEAFGKNLEDLKIPPYLAHIGLGESIKRPSGGIAETEAAMQQAIERGKRNTLTPEGITQQRLEMARPNEPVVVDTQGNAIPASRRQNMINAINDEQGIPANVAEVEAWKKANETAKEVEAAKEVSAENRGEAGRMQTAATALGVVPQIAAMANAPAIEPQYPNENGPEDRLYTPAPTPTPNPATAKTETVKQTEEPKQGRDWNDMLLNLGLGLMAGQSPYALQNLGTAGLNALRQEQEQKRATLEERKEAALEALQKQQGQYYGAQAGYLEDLRGPQAALASADKNYDAWLKSTQGMAATPEQARTVHDDFIKNAYKNLGIIHPSAFSAEDRRLVEQYAK